MDPNATWDDIRSALGDLRWDSTDGYHRADAIALLNDLAAWLARGGVPPEVK